MTKSKAGAKKSKEVSKLETQAAAVAAVKKEMTTPPLELFHDSTPDAWAKVYVNDHYENWQLSSQPFRLLLERSLRKALGCMPSAKLVKDTLRELEGTAKFDSPRHDVHLRLAGRRFPVPVEGHKMDSTEYIHIDLCDARWNTIQVEPNGWSQTQESPVKFRRAPGMKALPMPQHPKDGGDLNALWGYINVTERKHQILVLSWLVAALRPSGPYPILCMTGQQGSAKTTSQIFLRELVDPNFASLRQSPRDERDLSISAMSSHIQGFDNFSVIPNWLSDALCRLSTGSGFATRKLYTDSEQTMFQGQRPIMLNGITQIAERADLCDRMIIIPCPKISKRKADGALRSQFNHIRPHIFGALLNAVACALKNYKEVREAEHKADSLPRMAEFACWAIAAAPKLGFTREEFMEAYEANRQELRFVSLEFASVQSVIHWFNDVYPRILHRRDDCNVWVGTCKDLLSRIYSEHGMTPRKLSAELKRAEPNLEAVGLRWEELQRQPGTGQRIHRLSRLMPRGTPAPANPHINVTSVTSVMPTGETKIPDPANEIEVWLNGFMTVPKLASEVIGAAKYSQSQIIKAAKALDIWVNPSIGCSWQETYWRASACAPLAKAAGAPSNSPTTRVIVRLQKQ